MLRQPCRVVSARTCVRRRTSNTICYLSRTNRVDQDNDATACYDRIPPNLANLVYRSNGMDPDLCSIHGPTLDGMPYHLLTALGISEEAYQNETPIFLLSGLK
jgi:hypothetical protein